MFQTDVLIIGAGVAGLSTAIYLAEQRPDLKITVLTKTVKTESNTRYAQGGVAAVWNFEEDSYAQHIDDTIDAGDGLCDPEVVEMVVKEGRERIEDIISWGTRFDKGSDEKYDLGREGGHTENRILHYKDLTGWEIQRSLNQKVALYENVTIHEHFYAMDLITQHHLGYQITRVTPDIECYGVYVLNEKTGEVVTMLSKKLVIATGGAGQIYSNTTNPIIATGDGIAMFYRAKGRVENMEFIQFHPTALYNIQGEKPDFLISEAVRGFGAVLKTNDNKEFMHKYDERGSLAPRDIVARAIDNEMKMRGEDHVSLDCTGLNKDKFIAHFPTIYDKCMSLGIDPMKDLIPVAPACHYLCGGIKCDVHGRSSISHLYGIGECSSSGLHGANRLASNSLLEGLVYGQRAAVDIANSIDGIIYQDNIPQWDTSNTSEPKEMVLLTQTLKELKQIMSYYVGIVRTDIRLKRALDRLYILYEETETLYTTTLISKQLFELRNLITNAYLVSRSAEFRKESRGLHYNLDYPDKYTFVEDTLL